MVEIRAQKIETFFLKEVFSYNLFILYGPDRGLISEYIDRIKEKFGISRDNPFSFINLNLSDILKEKTKFIDEVYSSSLFDEKKIILVKDILNEKFILECIENISNNIPENNKIILTVKELKKNNRIRKIAETSNSIASIPCYTDDKHTLNSLINNELLTEKVHITPEARQTLLELLGGDRIASRNEIHKLSLYCLGKTLIKEEDVLNIIGDCSILSVDDIIYSAISGDTYNVFNLSKKFFLEKIPPRILLQACLHKFQFLDLMVIDMNYHNNSITETIQKLGKNIFFKRKPALQQALKIWKIDKIKNILSKINRDIQQTRENPILEKSIIMQSLLFISQEASKNKK